MQQEAAVLSTASVENAVRCHTYRAYAGGGRRRVEESDDKKDSWLLTPDGAKEYVKILEGDKWNGMRSEVEKAVYYTMDRPEQFSDS